MLPLGGGLDAATIVALAAEADHAGVPALAAGEHASTELFSLLGAIAARTDRVRLETAIVSTVSRSASLVAMAALTLDALAPGRISLGLGAGSPMVAAWHGQAFDRPVDRMRSFLTSLRTGLAGDRIDALGGFRALSRPAPDIAVRIAALGPHMLELAATRADGVLVNFAGPEQIARIAAGRAAPYDVHVLRWAALGVAEDVARQTFALEVGPYLAVPAYAAAAAEIAGHDAIAAAGQAWREGGRRAAAAAVPDALADELLVVGDAGTLADHATTLAANGCTALRLLPLSPAGPPSTAATTLRTVRTLIRAIADLAPH